MPSEHAKRLRAEATPAERRLWYRLRKRQLGGHRFRRQHALGPYIVDFVCLERRLVVELDGGQHASSVSYDARRTDWLEGAEFHVIRFWNQDVFENVDAVCDAIQAALAPAQEE